ncbi:MAG: penicillin acylase family protein, partial [Burkholderiales bacterium]|nr:penicillin acylase family protein [Burkholderiales bacterium]
MPSQRFRHAALLASLTALAGCAGLPGGDRSVQITRTTHGVAHVQAADMGMLAYGVAYAHAQDNVCQTAQQLVTVRGERSRFFGGEARGLLGLRSLPNTQVDLFIAAHMDDAALARAAAATSAEAQAMAEGYVAGYNRFLADQGSRLPAACQGQPWVRPMTLADFRRLGELSSVQAGIALMADAMLGAQPPAAQTTGQAPQPDPVALAQALRERGVPDSPFGPNAWAFGRDSTADGRGLLLGNPHFPWQGVNRFWQMHLTIPGQLDVMGAAIGHGAVVQIGFNRDIAWSHTVSTGKRFTLHALTLVPGEPTRYLVDGQPEAMRPQTLQIQVRQADGRLAPHSHTVWRTRWGPVVVLPSAKLGWTASTAYALQDANTGNARGADTWLAINRARSVKELPQALRSLGTPWVNTIAADREGDAFYADASVVPDVDAAQLQRCAAGPATAALLKA